MNKEGIYSMRFKTLLLCTLLSATTCAYCQQDLNPALSQSQSGEKNNAANEIKLPMPGALTSGWWDYFNVGDDKLLHRISLAKQQYTEQLTAFEKPQKKAARQNIDRFVSNLIVLNKLRKTVKNGSAITINKFKKYYSIEEWLDIKNRLRKKYSDFMDNQDHIETQKKALEESKNQLSDLQLKYVKLTVDSGEKFLLGLNIMADRSAIAVSTERLQLNKNALDTQSKQLDNLRKLSKIATTRLYSDTQLSINQDSLITGLQQKLTNNQQSLHKISANLMTIVGDNQSSSSQARMRDQEMTKLMIGAETLKLELASIEAKKDLSSLLLATNVSNYDDIQNHLQQWQDLIISSQRKALIWYKESATELTRIQDKILNRSLTNDVSFKLDNTLSQRSKLTQSSLLELRHLSIERDELNALSQEVDKRLVKRAGKFSYFFNWSTSRAEGFLNKLISWATEPLFTIGQTPVTAAGLGRVLLIIAIAGLISSLLRRSMDRLSERIETDDKDMPVFYIVGRLLHYVILFLGIIIALSSIGLDFTSIAMVASALSVGIGFGLQSIVNNFVSGLILFFEGTIKIGDFIELDSNVMGTVREINVRNTQVNTPDNVDIIIPNSVLVGGKVINWTLREANRRIHIPFGVAYGTDKELVKKAALEAAARVRFTLKPKHKHREAAQCWLVKFGDSSLDFELVVWINREAVRKPPMVYAAYLWEIESSLQEHGIEIPFPQRDLHLRSIVGDA